ncbi:tht1-like nuclear fusion protein [Hirsutella rhossiliensis]|uniref:Tht1-like nuclear fusion protein n=1 Tax=Hirsutella rhossiliensis TaxID=111463 RepID=A0A9P8SF54_9HYPO|nr:tht1-like nuclear fusion protein [Hirsutella rhossiliensis]KAH0958671.1 tht1-like nuclear fusion protein [Hirsutella rhossiliensis]
MARPAGLLLWLQAICLLCLSGAFVQAFSWAGSRGAKVLTGPQISHHVVSQQIPSNGRSSSNMYTTALDELQELESEPLCHRIAARLLVNNCQLLDGRDEATVLTDSGRATRDFVDFFAASLAICDLERGSFLIPSSCFKFREPVLAEMRMPSRPHLHVSPAEIDGCLEGLGQSDSAWNTFISYRHKALRFCEAARADNEKDRNILLFQRITKVMDRLTMQVEAELEARLEALNKMVRDANTNVESINPQINDLKSGLSQVEQMISQVLSQGTQQAATSANNGLQSAKRLQQLLERLLATALESNERITRSHESALQLVHKRVGDDVGAVMTTLGAAIAATTGLQREIAESQFRVAEIARGQERIEADMQRLSELANALTVKQEGHQERLEQAQQQALQVLKTLDSVSATAVTFKSTLLGGLGLTKWWPYVFCPVMSLIVGSYGLPPSTIRNIVLVGMGEAVGFLIFVANQYGLDMLERSMASANESTTVMTAT